MRRLVARDAFTVWCSYAGIAYRHAVVLGGRLSGGPRARNALAAVVFAAFRSYAARMGTVRWQEELIARPIRGSSPLPFRGAPERAGKLMLHQLAQWVQMLLALEDPGSVVGAETRLARGVPQTR